MLTAGLGTRLRPLTEHYAKPAVPFLGVPLLKYPMHLMRLAGVRSVVFNTHYLPEQIENLSRDVHQTGIQVQLSPEPEQPMGSGGGIKQAEKYLRGGDFMVANGDEVILPHSDKALARFMSEHTQHQALATILVMRHEKVGTQFGGVWTDERGAVRGFGMKSPTSGLTGYHYIGLLLLSPRVFQYLPEGESNILYDALTHAIHAGEVVRAVVEDFTWFETGNPKDYLISTGEALTLAAEGKGYSAETLLTIVSPLWRMKFQLEQDHHNITLRAKTAKIESGVRIRGFGVFGENSHVSKAVQVENCVLMPDAVLDHPAKDEIILRAR